jgi:hypothetical protein
MCCAALLSATLYVLDLFTRDIFAWVRDRGDQLAWEDAWNMALIFNRPEDRVGMHS